MHSDQPPQLLRAHLTSGDSVLLHADATARFTADLRWQRGRADADHAVIVDAEARRQRMLGFGAALTDASAAVLAEMPVDERSALLHELFGPVKPPAQATTHLHDEREALGLATLRLTIGASDFSTSLYNDEPLPGAFSLRHDERRLIPLLDEIRAIQPNLRLIASPWSAPPWMKTPPTMFGRLAPTLFGRRSRCRWPAGMPWPSWLGRRSRLSRRHFDDYARYLVHYCERMAELGHPIDLLTAQNEPGFAPGYPGMAMSVSDQIALIGKHLGPALKASPVHTRLLAHDHNWDAPDVVLRLHDDPVAGRYLSGTAWHGYAGQPSAQSVVHRAFPARSTHLTEITAFADPRTLLTPPIAQNLRWHMRMIALGATRNWAESITYWNLALDGHGGPFLSASGRSHMEGVVDVLPQAGHPVRRNVAYYSLAHLSAVLPGARHLASSGHETGYLLNSAFQNPDGTVALLLASDARERRPFQLGVHGWRAEVTLDPGDVVTLVMATTATTADAGRGL